MCLEDIGPVVAVSGANALASVPRRSLCGAHDVESGTWGSICCMKPDTTKKGSSL